MEPLVSIVTPNYNSEKYIAKTIQSVLEQSYKNWEMIIVDDCSSDDSIKTIESYIKKDSRIMLIKMDKNLGVALCRNKAIEVSRGKYLAYLDSDDLWASNKLKKQIQYMETNKVDFTYSKYTHIDEEGNILNLKARIPESLNYSKMLFHCFTGCLTVVYNQEKIGKIYGPNISKSNDYALFLQVIKKCDKARGIKENLAYYRIRKDSISRNKLKKIKPHLYLLNKIEKINIFVSLFLILTNILIKKIYKYERWKNEDNSSRNRICRFIKRNTISTKQ